MFYFAERQLFIQALSLEVKRPGRETGQSLYAVPRLRMREAIPPLPQYAFIA
jgi:hypothetical protein